MWELPDVARPPSRLANWDYFRFFLAVAETGSLSAASQVLGVSHPTVRRQIRDLESSLSAKLFNRTPDGYVLTAEGERMVDLAKTMEITAHAIERCTNAEESKCEGRVTLAAAAGIGTHWLAPKVAEFRRLHPAVEVELNISRSQLDLMRLEADIALRMGDPGGQDLVGRRVGAVSFGLYAARTYLDEHGTPQTADELKNHEVIDSTGEIAGLAQAQRLRDIASEAATPFSSNNLLTQFAAMQAGGGILPVPIYMTTNLHDVVRVLPDAFNVELDLWLLTHEDLIRTARVRTLMDFLIDSIRADPCFGGTDTSTPSDAPDGEDGLHAP